MCGRYAITLPPDTYREFFGYPEQPNFPPRYNVAPTQPVPVVLDDRGERHFRLVRWGFLPGWVKDPKDFPLVINARGETLETKPTFKAALKRRRCIFLTDGFYEWRRDGKEKTPFLIRPRDRSPMPTRPGGSSCSGGGTRPRSSGPAGAPASRDTAFRQVARRSSAARSRSAVQARSVR